MFKDFALPNFLLEAIDKLGWTTPSPIQVQIIPKALDGMDISGGAPTGTGKSAAFLLPIITRLAKHKCNGVQAIILEPTRELALQIENVTSSLLIAQEQALQGDTKELQDFISVGSIIGGEDRVKQREFLPTIVSATPGRLLEFLQKGWLKPDTVKILVIDEADRMLDMGFSDEVLAITHKLNCRQQTMLFSATLDNYRVSAFAKDVLHEPFSVHIGVTDAESERLPDLLQGRAYYAANSEQKNKILLHLLNTTVGKSIVFVGNKDNLNRLAIVLKRQGISFASLKGEYSQQERKAALRRFSEGEVSLLIATDIAARGLDIDDIAFVYNYDLPSSEIYVHRAGRTARAGAKGVVISLVEASQIEALGKIERYTKREIEKRAIKGVCADFSSINQANLSEKKRSRANPNGGFAKKSKSLQEEKKPKKKVRLRDKKNKGKPDFAQKRAKKAARLDAQKASKNILAEIKSETQKPETSAQ